MKKILGLLALFLLLASAAWSQSSVADTPASRDDVVKLFDLMNVRQQTQKTIEAMMQQQRAMVREAIQKRHPELTEEQLKHVDSLMDDFWENFPIDALIGDMIPVYQKHLTRGDVEAMNVFYASPTGKKLLAEMPAIMTDSMQAMMPHLQESMDKMMDRAEKQAKEEGRPKPTTVKN